MLPWAAGGHYITFQFVLERSKFSSGSLWAMSARARLTQHRSHSAHCGYPCLCPCWPLGFPEERAGCNHHSRRSVPQKRKCLAPSPASAVRVEGPALRWCEYPPGVKHMPSASGHLNPVFKVVLVHGRHQMVGPRHGNLSNYPPGSAWVKTRQHRAK